MLLKETPSHMAVSFFASKSMFSSSHSLVVVVNIALLGSFGPRE